MIPIMNTICGFIPSDEKIDNVAQSINGECVEYKSWKCFINITNVTRHKKEKYNYIINKNRLKQTYGIMPVYVVNINPDENTIELSRKRITDDEEKQYIENYSIKQTIIKELQKIIKEDKLQNIHEQLSESVNPMELFSCGFEEYVSNCQDISAFDFDLTPEQNVELAKKMYELAEYKTVILEFNHILNHVYASNVLTNGLTYVNQLIPPKYDKNYKFTFEKKNYKISIQSKIEKKAMQFLKECKLQFEEYLKQKYIHEPHLNTFEPNYGIQPNYNLMIIGNVAAGKTTLTKCLTGKSTLTSTEEKKTLHTKELGYASFTLCTKCSYLTHKCIECKDMNYINIMDCPGHKSFMKHAISGTKNIDYLILVVSATEGCHDQTINHLLMCEMAGFRDPSKILILLNKSELIVNDLKNTMETTRDQLKNTIAYQSPMYPISAISGNGLNRVYEWLSNLPKNKKLDNDVVIFPVIRSFNSNKCGTTNVMGGIIGVTGLQGTIHLNDTIYINPGIYDKTTNTCEPIETKVLSIQTELDQLREASSGGCVALGTTIDPQFTTNNFMVGMVISTDKLMVADHCKLENIQFIKYADSKSPSELFKKNIKIQFLTHLVNADIEKYSKSRNMAKVKFDKPIAITHRKQQVSLYTPTFELIGKCEIIFEGCNMPDEYIDVNKYEKVEYDETNIVNEFIEKCSEQHKTKVQIPPFQIYMETKSKLIIYNANEIMQSVNRDMELLKCFIKEDLNVTASIVNQSIHVNIKMNKNVCEKNMTILIKKCLAKYVQCKQCKSLHTDKITVENYKCKDCLGISSIIT